MVRQGWLARRFHQNPEGELLRSGAETSHFLRYITENTANISVIPLLKSFQDDQLVSSWPLDQYSNNVSDRNHFSYWGQIRRSDIITLM